MRAAALCDTKVRPEDLPERIRNFNSATADETDAVANLRAGQAGEEWPPLSEIEARYVARVLAHTGGNKQAAARLLDIDRKTLQRMINRHHIQTKTGMVHDPSGGNRLDRANATTRKSIIRWRW